MTQSKQYLILTKRFSSINWTMPFTKGLSKPTCYKLIYTTTFRHTVYLWWNGAQCTDILWSCDPYFFFSLLSFFCSSALIGMDELWPVGSRCQRTRRERSIRYTALYRYQHQPVESEAAHIRIDGFLIKNFFCCISLCRFFFRCRRTRHRRPLERNGKKMIRWIHWIDFQRWQRIEMRSVFDGAMSQHCTTQVGRLIPSPRFWFFFYKRQQRKMIFLQLKKERRGLFPRTSGCVVGFT